MSRPLLALTLAALLPASAVAGQCDTHARKASTAQGDALVSAYQDMLDCNKEEAQAAFEEFMRASGATGTETLVQLAVTAIDAQAYTPVWGMMEKIKDYNQRDDVANDIGAQCAEHPEVVTFLKGAYYGLRDIQFGQWDKALITCEQESLTDWVTQIAAKPPTTSYDEKYDTILSALVKKRKADALPVLQRAAVEAANNNGPFNAIVEKMNEAVRPDELGADITPENRQRLEEALTSVANAVGPEQAAMVADRLFNAGAEQAAASLLPRVYPDRVQSDGSLLYGAASIENCDQQAYVHYVAVREPASRWAVLKSIEEPARSFKSRLKCDTSGPWPVVATAEPVADEGDIEAWAAGIVSQWEGKGFDVKSRQEKDLTLE